MNTFQTLAGEDTGLRALTLWKIEESNKKHPHDFHTDVTF